MATVTINGRAFEVKDRQAPGGLGRSKKQMEAALASIEATKETMFDLSAAHVASYLDGADLPWLLDNLPTDASAILRECIVASGGKVSEPKKAASQ